MRFHGDQSLLSEYKLWESYDDGFPLLTDNLLHGVKSDLPTETLQRVSTLAVTAVCLFPFTSYIF